MTSITFEVPGEPRGKGRPRAAHFAGRTRLFTDEKTVTYENRVAKAASDAMAGKSPFDGPVVIFLSARLQTPSTGSKRRRAQMLAGELRPTKIPDLANVLCAVQDGMNQVVYRDDRQVVQVTMSKHWSTVAGLTVTVKELLP